MPEPRIDPDFADIRFRDRHRTAPQREDGASLFWKGVAIFIGVALVHPIYSYAVQTRLAARDVNEAVRGFTDEMEALSADSARRATEATRLSAEAALAQRLNSVTLAGSTVIGGQRVVIVDLGQASYAEARDRICDLAERRFSTSLAGERLRVQRHRGRQPATELAMLSCS